MKKVIILSYFFPPANFVGAERAAFWAKYLKEFDIYPIIITRCWNDNETDVFSQLKSNNYKRENYDGYEVIRLPIKTKLRNILSKIPMIKSLTKILTLWEVLWSNFFITSLHYSNFYFEAKKVIIDDKEVIGVIASGRPFNLFQIGYKLKKKFPNLIWIPDYRDEWSTNTNHNPKGLIGLMLKKFESRNELKWTSNANTFISVSSSLVKNISSYIKLSGVEILNGYNKLHQPEDSKKNQLDLVYTGTVYPYQNFEIIINAIKNINKNNSDKIKLHLIGINTIPKEKEKLINLINNDKNFYVKDRVNKKLLQHYIDKSDVLFLTSYEHNKGWYPVKMLEYYALGKPILLCPSDLDTMEEFILNSNSGLIANTIEECKSILFNWLREKEKGKSILMNRNLDFGENYSRRTQTKKLASLFNNIAHE